LGAAGAREVSRFRIHYETTRERAVGLMGPLKNLFQKNMNIGSRRQISIEELPH
jgi:hypothetical protein